MTQPEPDEGRSDLLGECHAVVRDTWNEARSDLLSECHAMVHDTWFRSVVEATQSVGWNLPESSREETLP